MALEGVSKVAVHDDSKPDDLEEFLVEQEAADPSLRGAIADAECRRTLIAQLVRCRQGHRTSQTLVASRMETSQSAVSELEGGGTDPRLSTLQRYARAVDCQLSVHVHSFRSLDAFGGWRTLGQHHVVTEPSKPLGVSIPWSDLSVVPNQEPAFTSR